MHLVIFTGNPVCVYCIYNITFCIYTDPGVPYEVRVSGVTVAGSGTPGFTTCFSKELGTYICIYVQPQLYLFTVF